jgi:hypothetical protein
VLAALHPERDLLSQASPPASIIVRAARMLDVERGTIISPAVVEPPPTRASSGR